MLDSSRTRIAALLVSTVLIFAVLGSQKLRQDILFSRSLVTDDRIAETSYIPPNQVLVLLALGHEAFVADTLFSLAQQYFFTHLTHDRKFIWLDTYMNSIIGYCEDDMHHQLLKARPECRGRGLTWVDGIFPFNPRVYTWVSQVMKFSPVLTNSIVDKAVYYGQNGIHFCPESWEIYFDLGFNYFFEYTDLPQDRRKASKDKGLQYIMAASKLPGADIDPNFVLTQLWARESDKEAKKMLFLTWYGATDREREELKDRLDNQGETQLSNYLAEEEGRWRDRFPFLPLRLYAAIEGKEDRTEEKWSRAKRF